MEKVSSSFEGEIVNIYDTFFLEGRENEIKILK